MQTVVAKQDAATRYRMYKAHGQWMVAGTTTLAMAAALLAGGAVSAHADVTNASAVAPSTALTASAATSASSTSTLASATNTSTTTPAVNAGATTGVNTQAVTPAPVSISVPQVSQVSGPVAPAVNNANAGIANAVANNRQNVANAGGNLTQESNINVPTQGSTASQVASVITSGAQSQENLISAVGSIDGQLKSDADSVNASSRPMGGGVQAGSAMDMTGKTVSDVVGFGNSQAAKIAETGSANAAISDEVSRDLSDVTKADGVLKPGSAVDIDSMTSAQVSESVAHAKSMVYETAKGDSQIVSAVMSAQSDIQANGGTITRSGEINTADDMTVSGVSSAAQSEVDRISATASGDRMISGAVSDNQSAVSHASGTLVSGDSIDTTGMTQSQIDSIAAHQKSMVDATGSADSDIMSHVQAGSSAINQAGGSISLSGNVNTADNMTSSDIASDEKSQADNVDHVASGDSAIASASANSSATNAFGGSFAQGSSADMTGKTASEIDSMANSEVAKLSQVESANSLESDTQIKVSDVTNAMGGKVSAGSVWDVTNVDPSDVASVVASENDTLSAVGDGNRQIGSALTQWMNQIQNAGGTIMNSGTVNMAGHTASEVESFAKSEAANIIATGSGDVLISNTASDVASDYDANGAKLTKGSALDMTGKSGSEVTSIANSMADAMSNAGSINVAQSSMVASGNRVINDFGGRIVEGSHVDVSSMSPSEIASMGNSEIATASSTMKGDQMISDAVKNGSSAINEAGGQLIKGSEVNTASMKASQVDSLANSQATDIKNAGSADQVLTSVESSASSVMANAGGKVHHGSAIDAAGSTASEMNSAVQSQAHQMDLAGSADTKLSSYVADNRGAIEGNGGTLTSSQATDATHMTSAQMSQAVSDQGANMSAVAQGDLNISDAVAQASSETTKRGAATDMTGKTRDDVASNVASQVSRIGQTQMANDTMSAGESMASSAVHQASGEIIKDSLTDVTGMTEQEVASHLNSETAKLAETGTADDVLNQQIKHEHDAVYEHGGVIQAGSHTDATKMGSLAIANDVNSQASHISQVGSGASIIDGAVDSNIDAVSQAGGSLVNEGTKDATRMGPEEIGSYANQTSDHIQHVGDGDRKITSASNAYTSGAEVLGGKLTSMAAVDVTSDDDATIDSMAQSVANWLSGVASANVQASSQAASAKSEGAEISVSQVSATNSQELNSIAATNTSTMASAGNVVHASVAVSNAVQLANSVVASLKAELQAMGSAIAVRTGATVTYGNGINGSNARAMGDSAVAQTSQQAASMIAAVNSAKAAYQSMVTMVQNSKHIQYASNGYTPSNSWQNVAIGNGPDGQTIEVVDNNSANNRIDLSAGKRQLDVNVFSDKLDKAHIITGVVWNQGDTPDLVSGSWSNQTRPGYDYAGATSQIYTVNPGTTLRFHKAVSLGDGTKRDLLVTFGRGGDKVASNQSIAVWSGANHEISMLMGGSGTDNHNYATMDCQIDGGSGKYLWSAVESDIDIGQSFSFDGGSDSADAGIIGIGGGLRTATTFSNVIYADHNLGFPGAGGYGKDFDAASGLKDWQSSPDGCAAVYVLGSTFHTRVQNNGGGSIGVACGLFGQAATIKPQLISVNLHDFGLNIQTPKASVLSTNASYTALSSKYAPLSTQYSPYDVHVTDHYQYTYSPLSTTWSAMDITTTPYSASYHPLSDVGGLTPMDMTYHPLSTSFQSESDYDYTTPDGKTHRGYGPLSYTTTPLSTTYHNFSSDGQAVGKDGKKLNPYLTDENGNYILDKDGHRILNPNFTGYTPLSTTYKTMSSDGTKVPSLIPDGHGGWKINPKFTGYVPYRSHYSPASAEYALYNNPDLPAPQNPGNPGNPDNPDNPGNPGNPGSPASPASPAPATSASPAVMPVASSASAAPAPSSPAPQALPQTNGQNEAALFALGMALAGLSMGLLVDRKKK